MLARLVAGLWGVPSKKLDVNGHTIRLGLLVAPLLNSIRPKRLVTLPGPGEEAVVIGGRIGVAIVFALSIAVYVPAFGLGFVEFDDNIYVFRNPHVSAGLTKESILYALTTFDSGNWIPVTWLSYLLDATLFGIRPMAFHGVNVVLHGLNAVLIFCWLHRKSSKFWRSFAVAALFAVHPLHVESVAWIAERKDVLSTFFFLAMLIAYDAYSSRPNFLRYLTVLVTYTLGLLSKSMLVTAPLVLVFVDLWLRPVPESSGSVPETKVDRTVWWRIGDKIPLLMLAAVIGLATVRCKGRGRRPRSRHSIAFL